jgi:hypothetical protein
MAKQYSDGAEIGPLICQTSRSHPEELLRYVLHKLSKQHVEISVLETNLEAVKVAESMGFYESAERL